MILDYLKLTRFPLVLTAMADSLTGYFITRHPADHRYEVPALLAALSALLYSAGMVINDVEDYERDRQIHPERVLPRGSLKPKHALIFGGILLILAVVISNFIFARTVAVTMLLIVFIYTYDHVFKQNRLLGPLNMGFLRFLNFGLGLSAVMEWGSFDWKFLAFPAFLFLYVTFLTLLSTLEEGESRKETFMLILAAMIFTVIGLNFLLHESLTALVLSLGIAAALGYRGLQSWRVYSTPNVRTAVLWGVISIIPLDAMIAAGHERYTLALIFIFGFLPATFGFIKLSKHV